MRSYEEPKVEIIEFPMEERIMLSIVDGEAPDKPIGRKSDLW